MREKKFRAWDKRNKRMYYDNDKFYPYYIFGERERVVDPCEITNKGIMFWYCEARLPNASPESFDHIIIYNIDIDIMQYTGIKDKNGKEIYEGDILKTYYYDSEIPNEAYLISSVEFNNKLLQYCNGLAHNISITKHESIKIIGNVYENKNLLEED